MDELKKYIREFRDELDVEMPPPSHVWQNTAASKQSLTVTLKWAAVASVFLFLSTAMYWMMSTSRSKDVPQAEIIKNNSNEILNVPDPLDGAASPSANDTGSKTIHDLRIDEEEHQKEPTSSKPLRQVKSRNKWKPSSQSLEANYAHIISYQLKRLERTPIYAESADYFHVFKKQWYDMEKDEEKIKEDIEVYGLNDMLVDQFIQLYRQKIGLLKQLQSEINQMNIKARCHPAFRKQTPTYFKM